MKDNSQFNESQRKLHDQFGPEPPKNKKDLLLVIELEDESSVPKVFYKGEKIKLKTNIFFDWDTDTDLFGGLTYAIEHYEEGNKFPTLKRIERKVKGHA